MSIISVDQIGARVSGAAVTVSGGRFDVGSNVQLDGGTGVVTATSFSGNLSGTPTLGTGVTVYGSGIVSATSYKGDGSSLTGIAVTSDINTNNIKVSGITTLGTETTVVGSAVTFDASGGTIVGVLTATSFSGDGSALAGIAATDNINTNNIQVSGITTFQSLQEPFDFWMFSG